MKQELQTLERNQTWEVVPLPTGKSPIGCKWVYKTKLREDGSVERHKARFVAKGYTQVEGVDYTERFSPVAKTITVRLFLALATTFQWSVHQIDINNAFLHGHLDEEIFMVAPEVLKVLVLGNLDMTTIYSSKLWKQVKQHLDVMFTIKDLGVHVTSLVFKLGVLRMPATTPLPLGVKLYSTSGVLLDNPEPYRRLATFHLVRYLKGCSDVGLFFPSSNSLQVQAFCDADWGACADSRRSLTGFAIFLGPALISWKTKKQCTVSQSSAEAEYRSMATTACELQWISYLLRDFGVNVSGPIPFHCDNQVTLHIMANPVFHERTKHLDIEFHIVRDLYKASFLLPVFVRSKDQVADLFTKSLSSPVFLPLLRKLGLFAFAPSPTCLGGGVLSGRKVSVN
ncbi:UNVERIFIED_CONTAM: Retrovirus-related Pol polyprotein from transposon RE2 [Sesamum indicum]